MTHFCRASYLIKMLAYTLSLVVFLYIEVQHTHGLYLLVGPSVVPDEQLFATHLDATKNCQPAVRTKLACQAQDNATYDAYANQVLGGAQSSQRFPLRCKPSDVAEA